MSIYPGPVAPENNPPINPQYYSPRISFIYDITNGPFTNIITVSPNEYVVGQLIRILIPFGYGASQLNQQEGYIIQILTDRQFFVDIDSTNYDNFNNSYTLNLTKPQIIAIGDISNGTTNANGRVLNSTAIPGSFINISPQ